MIWVTSVCFLRLLRSGKEILGIGRMVSGGVSVSVLMRVRVRSVCCLSFVSVLLRNVSWGGYGTGRAIGAAILLGIIIVVVFVCIHFLERWWKGRKK